ncbi:MAG: insulinase family protein [Bacilli bacterium]
MKYKDIEIGSNCLHMIKTDKFKTITIQVHLKQPIERENITKSNLLTTIILEGTKKYPSRRSLALEGENLYNVLLSASCYRLGLYSNINIEMTLLEEKYTESGMLDKSLAFLSEIVFNNKLKDGTVSMETFSSAKDEVKTNINNGKESHDAYSIVRLLENMDNNQVFAYRENGYIEDLETITPEIEQQYYNQVLISSYFDIYVLGDIDFSEMETLIRKYFNISTFKKPREQAFLPAVNKRNTPLLIKEPETMNQSKLAIACSVKPSSLFETNYVYNIYTIILGSGPDSKFFKNIREKHSLAYYISASMRKLDNLIILKAGIDKNNFDKTVKLIEHEMTDMINGKFTDLELANALEAYKNRILEIEDMSDALIEARVATDLMNADPLAKRSAEIEKVTKEDVVNFAKKVSINTIFLLEGVEDNHED